MVTVSLHPQIVAYLEAVEGQTPDDKLVSLLETYLAARLRACELEIGEYEIKYRSTFDEFAQAWEQGRVAYKHSHAIERDYMEWEGLIAEKQRWLKLLQKLPEPRADGETTTP